MCFLKTVWVDFSFLHQNKVIFQFSKNLLKSFHKLFSIISELFLELIYVTQLKDDLMVELRPKVILKDFAKKGSMCACGLDKGSIGGGYILFLVFFPRKTIFNKIFAESQFEWILGKLTIPEEMTAEPLGEIAAWPGRCPILGIVQTVSVHRNVFMENSPTTLTLTQTLKKIKFSFLLSSQFFKEREDGRKIQFFIIAFQLIYHFN